jgi:hypothetical protein
MKITTEHYNHIKQEIDKLLAANPEAVARYERGEFSRSEKTKDLQRRFCFDVMRAAGLNKWICDNIYPYANDDHIYTALRKACPVVTRKF